MVPVSGEVLKELLQHRGRHLDHPATVHLRVALEELAPMLAHGPLDGEASQSPRGSAPPASGRPLTAAPCRIPTLPPYRTLRAVGDGSFTAGLRAICTP
jgi:hypothetical protein